MQTYHQMKQGERGAMISITVYLVLSIIKLLVSGWSGSSALFADGLNNATDVLSSVAVLVGLKIARKPPDHNHHYGHYRAELIASLVASFIMVTVGVQVLISATQTLLNGTYSEPSALAFWTALLSGAVMYLTYLFNHNLAKKINSSGLKAASLDNRSDSFISFAAAIGILASTFGMPILDPLLAAFVGVIIIVTAFSIFKTTSHTLTDGFDRDTVMTVKDAVSRANGVLGIRDIRGRKLANQSILDMIIYVDPTLTVKDAHDITDRIEIMLKHRFGIQHVTIHVEPSVIEEDKPPKQTKAPQEQAAPEQD